MAKTDEELNVIKDEVKTFVTKLKELSDDELKEVVGYGSIEDYNKDVQHYLDGLINPNWLYSRDLNIKPSSNPLNDPSNVLPPEINHKEQ